MSEKPGRQVGRPETQSEQVQINPSRGEFAEKWPYLYAFLHDRRDFGETHQTGSMTLFIDGDKLKCCLNDRPTRRSCFASAETLGELFAVADRGIGEGSHRWSAARYKRRSRTKNF